VCGAADEQEQRPFLLEAVPAPKRVAIACLEAFGGKPGRQYFDAPADAVSEQSLLHGVRGRNYGIQLIALRAAEAASQAAGDLARQQRHVVMQVLFEERVVRGNYGRALLAGESKPSVMRQKRGMDVHHVEFARS